MISQQVAQQVAQRVQAVLADETAKTNKENQIYAEYLAVRSQIEETCYTLNKALKDAGSLWELSLEENGQLYLWARADAVKSIKAKPTTISLGTVSYRTSGLPAVYFRGVVKDGIVQEHPLDSGKSEDVDRIFLQVLNAALAVFQRRL